MNVSGSAIEGTAPGGRLDRWFERWVAPSKARFFLSIFLPLGVIYAATASWTLPQDPDVVTIAVSAWHLGNTGSPFLPGYEQLTDEAYFGPMGSFRMAPGGPVSQYPPGSALVAAPLYAVTPGDLRDHTSVNHSRPELPPVNLPMPPFWPATLAGVLTTAGAIATLGLVFLGLGPRREAWVAAYVAGLGTSAWSVASGQLFMHGPAMLWISLGLLGVARARYLGSGLAFGAALLTRPHTAVIAACVGVICGVRDRSVGPVVRVGLGSVAGMAALLGYNFAVHGSVSISGGYGSAATQNLLDPDPTYFLRNVVGGLVHPRQGFLIWSPFLALLLPGLVRAWRSTDKWVWGAAIGGLLYLLLQYKMNRFNPGNTTLYRYPLEALTASAPLWFVAYQRWIRGTGRRARFFAKLVVLSIAFQALGVYLRLFMR